MDVRVIGPTKPSSHELEELDADHVLRLGTPVGVGRTRRTISAQLRKALVARDRHCRFPGCDMPVDWTDGHHKWHWVHGGPTVLWNLTLLCGRHHRLVHEGGWQLQDVENGGLVALPP